MARRKKEEPFVHRQAIANAAHELFSVKGIENTSMDAIAKLSGYSKATLYVYFKDKEQLVFYLTLNSLKKVYEIIKQSITDTSKSLEDRFFSVCNALYEYQQQYPFYFALAITKDLRVLEQTESYTDDEKEGTEVGNRINQVIYDYLSEGKKANIFREDLKEFETVFALWAMVSGVINMAANKKYYIEVTTEDEIKAYLKYSFSLIYKSILK